MNLGPLLVAVSGPIARQVLVSLGVGVVTMVGVDAALTSILGAAKAAWAGLPGAVAQYVALSGVNTGLALVAGACSARVSMMVLKSMRLL